MRILQISQLISTIDDGQNPQGCHCSEKKPPPAVDEEEDCGITLSTRYTDDADDKPSSKDSEKARHIARLSILLFCKTDDMFHGPVSRRTCRRAEAKDRYQQQSNLHASDDDDDNITDDDGFSTVLQTVVDPPNVSGVAWALFLLSGDFQTKPLQISKEPEPVASKRPRFWFWFWSPPPPLSTRQAYQ